VKAAVVCFACYFLYGKRHKMGLNDGKMPWVISF